MSRLKHTLNEFKAFNILRHKFSKKILKLDPNAQILPEQVDKPDFGFILKGRRMGLEVCSVDSEALLKQLNTNDCQKNRKAKEKLSNAISENKALTLINQTTGIGSDIYKKILSRKFQLYETYKVHFEQVFLLIHSDSYIDPEIYEPFRIGLNNYCIENNCPFEKVFFVSLNNRRYVGRVFEKKSPKKLKTPSFIESETRVKHFVPINTPINLYDTYK